ncbi:MAG: SAM-dependent DNA methyltransferase [Butyrivibrio sp.]|nr:SAM-dependent DNA methyltransferase [Butyrivibrio sp.]
MAVKKSELYSLLWEACNKLRGGVEPARYKDYVLVLLFFKYVSDRYKGERRSEFTIKQGASFDELIDAKYTPDVAETVDKILQKFLEDNGLSGSLPDVSFNNPDELGTGKELVDKVSGLIAVFENPAIDFRSNRASGDDIIGDAYEYFMMKFAQESGKSKGQFYTPSEVSRIIARLIGIGDIKPSLTKKWTLYDPAAGSGSLLIRAADEAPTDANGKSIVSIFGQEKDHATAGLAKMNFILHQKGTGEIVKGNTLSSPGYLDEFDQLRKFDFIVMNPPFSDKSWSDGIKTSDDKYKRFDGYGIPPEKNGDYAWFLHVLKSLNPDGKAGIILPHGVLFRGNTEETIRIEILNKKYIKGIVSLPANLFYGTGIPACIVIIDKENADSREGIFLIDASQDFKKDGNKNRLREQDIERIVQTFLNQVEIPGYSRFVRYEDVVKKNGGNLNVPRYIQKIDATLPQNIAAHLRGGIPRTDIESIDKLWRISPALKEKIFTCTDPKQGIYQLALPSVNLEKTVVDDDVVRRELSHETDALFNEWKESVKGALLGINLKTVPRDFIRSISLKLLEKFKNSKILDAYDVYDCLLNYWVAKLQDDVYAIKAGGYEVGREIDFEYAQKKAKDKTGHAITVDDKSKEKSFDGALIPKEIIEQEYFVDDLKKIQMFTEEAEAINVQMEELREEESGEEGLLREVLNDKGDNIPKANLTKRLKEIKDKGTDKNEDGDEYTCLTRYKGLMDKRDADLKKSKDARNALDKKLKDKYGELTVEEIKELLFEKKWMAKIVADINAVAAQVLNDLSSTVLLIAKRYEHTLGEIEKSTAESRVEVMAALERMGYKW